MAPIPAHGRQQVAQHVTAGDGAVHVADHQLGAPAVEVDVSYKLRCPDFEPAGWYVGKKNMANKRTCSNCLC
jgi:hypothetical protein